MNNLKINHLAVLVSVVLLHALGMIWYGTLFMDSWIAMVGMEMDNPDNPQGAGLWITNSLAIIAAVYIIAWILVRLGVTSGIRGAGIAFLVTFCLLHLTLMRNHMFAGDPYGLAWINGGYALTGNTIAGFILGAWTKNK